MEVFNSIALAIKQWTSQNPKVDLIELVDNMKFQILRLSKKILRIELLNPQIFHYTLLWEEKTSVGSFCILEGFIRNLE